MHELDRAPSGSAHRTALIVIEEPTIRELVSFNLRHAGFFPVTASSSLDGQRLASEVRPDVVVIDMDSPATSDTTFATELRAADQATRVPTVMMTSDVMSSCGQHGGACGATLCLSKPFSPQDLVRRIMRQLRPASVRYNAPGTGRLQAGPLMLDGERQTAAIARDGDVHEVTLRPAELKVLRCLMTDASRTLSREQILVKVWGRDSGVDLRTVDQCIRRLRSALQAIGAGALIKTVRGCGYRIDSADRQSTVEIRA